MAEAGLPHEYGAGGIAEALEAHCWVDGPMCPSCGSTDHHTEVYGIVVEKQTYWEPGGAFYDDARCWCMACGREYTEAELHDTREIKLPPPSYGGEARTVKVREPWGWFTDEISEYIRDEQRGWGAEVD